MIRVSRVAALGLLACAAFSQTIGAETLKSSIDWREAKRQDSKIMDDIFEHYGDRGPEFNKWMTENVNLTWKLTTDVQTTTTLKFDNANEEIDEKVKSGALSIDR